MKKIFPDFFGFSKRFLQVWYESCIFAVRKQKLILLYMERKILDKEGAVLRGWRLFQNFKKNCLRHGVSYDEKTMKTMEDFCDSLGELVWDDCLVSRDEFDDTYDVRIYIDGFQFLLVFFNDTDEEDDRPYAILLYKKMKNSSDSLKYMMDFKTVDEMIKDVGRLYGVHCKEEEK